MINFKEMVLSMKKAVITEFPEDYPISDELQQIINVADTRLGVKGFSGLLIQSFDCLMNNPEIAPEEGTVNSRGHTIIYVDIRNLLAMLYTIGLHSRYDEKSGSLTIDGKQLNKLYRKIRGNKPELYLRILEDSGMDFSVDITAKNFNLSKTGVIEIAYPDEKHTLAGLKIIAEANLRSKTDFVTVFARCDYNVLALPKKIVFNIHEIAKFLAENDQKYFISLHEYLIANQCKYETKYSVGEYLFLYTSKSQKRKILSICISLDRTYVKLNSKHITTQPDLLADAPASIKNAVKEGWECAKANNPDACNPKCAGKGLRFSLDGKEYLKCWILCFNLPVNTDAERGYVMKWIEKELD